MFHVDLLIDTQVT